MIFKGIEVVTFRSVDEILTESVAIQEQYFPLTVWRERNNRIIGNFSTDVREPRTATESRIFPFFGVVLLLTMDSFYWWLWLDVTNAMACKRPKKGKTQFPVDVHGSETSVLKLPNIFFRAPPDGECLALASARLKNANKYRLCCRLPKGGIPLTVARLF